MIVIRVKSHAFAVSTSTADATFANTLQASQKTTSILAKYAYALHAFLIKTVRNGGKEKIFKMIKNTIICVILAVACCMLAYMTRGLHL